MAAERWILALVVREYVDWDALEPGVLTWLARNGLLSEATVAEGREWGSVGRELAEVLRGSPKLARLEIELEEVLDKVRKAYSRRDGQKLVNDLLMNKFPDLSLGKGLREADRANIDLGKCFPDGAVTWNSKVKSFQLTPGLRSMKAVSLRNITELDDRVLCLLLTLPCLEQLSVDGSRVSQPDSHPYWALVPEELHLTSLGLNECYNLSSESLDKILARTCNTLTSVGLNRDMRAFPASIDLVSLLGALTLRPSCPCPHLKCLSMIRCPRFSGRIHAQTRSSLSPYQLPNEVIVQTEDFWSDPRSFSTFLQGQSLEELSLSWTWSISHALPEFLATHFKDTLVFLDLDGTNLGTLSDAKAIAKCENLETLSLAATALSDEGLQELSCLARLGTFDIRQTSCSSQGLQKVASGPAGASLVELNIGRASGVGVGSELFRCTNLRRLYCPRTALSLEEMREIITRLDLQELCPPREEHIPELKRLANLLRKGVELL